MITPIQHAKQQKHTPGPLEVSGTSIVSGKYCIAVIEDDGGYEAPAEEREANAEHLAHCWNVHDQLVEALQSLMKAYGHPFHGENGTGKSLPLARAALLAATGKDTL